MRRPSLLILLLVCAACVPFGQPKAVAPSDALSIEYNLPVTSVRLSMELMLVDCSNGNLVARPTGALQPAANANSEPTERFRLFSTALSSWTRNRQVSIELHGNGAIKAVNGGVSDRTGAIITNILKTALSIVPMFDDSAAQASGCNASTQAALAKVQTLTSRIDVLRSALPSAPPNRAQEIRLAVDALAAEVARIRTEQLTISLSKDLEIPRKAPVEGAIQWTGADLARWLPESAPSTAVKNFQLGYCVTPFTAPDGCKQTPTRPPPPNPTPTEQDPAKCRPQCGHTIVLREPVNAVLFLRAASGDFARLSPSGSVTPIAANSVLQKTAVPVAQWGTLSYIPLEAGFGESNTFALGLDEFGRRSSFTWKSDARAEGITGSISSIADATAKLESALRNQDLLEQQAEISRLQTLQNLNRLRFCREVLEAGGFNCPTS